MGRNGGPEKKSERKAITSRENRRKPRTGPTKTEAERTRLARGRLNKALPIGTRALLRFIRDSVNPETGQLIVTGRENFEAFVTALNFAADRGGLPRLSEQRVMGDTITPIRIRLEGLKPPWLEAQENDSAEGKGAPGDGAGNGEPHRANGSG